MDVFSLARACLRRWYVFIPLLAITAVASVLQAKGVKPLYSRSAVIVVLPSNTVPANQTPSATKPINPLTSVSVASSALTTTLSSGQAALTIARESGSSAGYGIGAGNKKGAGQLTISASGPSAVGTSRTLLTVLKEAGVQLKSLQSGVKAPSGSYFQLYTLNVDVSTSKSYPQRSRNIVLVALAGVLVSILLTQLADYLLGLRTTRRTTSRHGRDDLSPASPRPSNGVVANGQYPDRVAGDAAVAGHGFGSPPETGASAHEAANGDTTSTAADTSSGYDNGMDVFDGESDAADANSLAQPKAREPRFRRGRAK